MGQRGSVLVFVWRAAAGQPGAQYQPRWMMEESSSSGVGNSYLSSFRGPPQFREVAEHLGVAMADVFAAEKIIWVEGATEELCFPLLYQHAAKNPLPRGTIFTSVIATGDFMSKKRDRKLVFEIYERLSGTAAPLVTSVAFSFDSEDLSPDEKEDMDRQSGGLIHFLPRRHLECYLINPVAIAAFVVSKDTQSTGIVTAEVVSVKLAELPPFLHSELMRGKAVSMTECGKHRWMQQSSLKKFVLSSQNKGRLSKRRMIRSGC